MKLKVSRITDCLKDLRSNYILNDETTNRIIEIMGIHAHSITKYGSNIIRAIFFESY